MRPSKQKTVEQDQQTLNSDNQQQQNNFTDQSPEA